MASAVSENGNSVEEPLQTNEIGECTAKVNGEVNGAFEEPMDVDSPVNPVKKVHSSETQCITESTDKDSASDIKHLDETNIAAEGSDAELHSALSSEVPETENVISSNGYLEENEESDKITSSSEKISDSPVLEKEDIKEANSEDDVMLVESEEPQDPFAAQDPFAEESKQDEPESSTQEKSAISENENDNPSDSSDIEHIEDTDPLKLDDDEQKEELKTQTSDAGNVSVDDEAPDENSGKQETQRDNAESKELTEENETKSDDCETNHFSHTSEKKEEEKEKTEEKKEENVEKDEDKMEVVEDESDSPDKTKLEDDNEKTPDKSKKKKPQQQPINVTPRRSSRNVNKPKVYIDEPDIKGNSSASNSTPSSTPTKKVHDDDPDIEEIVPVDPLATDSPVSDKKNKKTVVVNDPKRLVEIASGSKQTKPGKKEPTLVIIDTNSILSGKGPVPVSASPPLSHSPGLPGPSHSQAYSVLPMALPAQGMYPQPMRHPQMKPMGIPSPGLPITPSPPPQPKPPVILPSLTDDMYVVEAPSFIVPYVYEKPPIKPLKNFVDQIEQAINDIKAQLLKQKEEEKKLEKEKEKEKESEEETKKEEKGDSEKSDKVEEGKESEKKEDEKMEVDQESAKDTEEAKTDKEETKEAEKADVKSIENKPESEKSAEKPSEEAKSEEDKTKKQSNSYFDNPLGKFFIQIGVNLVQEHVQTDLLRSQKRKKEREGSKCTPEVLQAMNSLVRSLEFSKETNEPFKMELKKCEFCSFKTESALVMAHHLETPHMRNYVYRCNFCPLEVRSPHDILYHMEAEHNVRGRLERAPAFHQCPSCPFEDNQKGKLSRHLLSCAKKYRPERNQEPPLDFEPPAKIPRVSRNRPSMSPGTAVYQAAMSGLKQGVPGPQHPLLPKLVPAPTAPGIVRGRGRPQMINRYLGDMRSPAALAAQQKAMAQMRPAGMLYRPSGSNAQPQVLLPTSYQLAGTQLYQVATHNRGLPPAPPPLALPTQNAVAAAAAASVSASKSSVGSSTAKLLQQPSISITPLPRQQPPPAPAPAPTPIAPVNKPGRPAGSSKATFVICEICDGYIKDLEQLRNHMQWIHKVKIHPKMIYNRPPLNCQKCQFRFFTDQGLERHLLGSHGLVTSSMQEAANKGKDGGRCPVCGRVYQWKLLNHVARDHNMSLKPAHLSYKCTVCTATFGMYKQFENHVYSAHSVVAKRVMDKKPAAASAPSTSSQGDMLKPLKINDEITIIPQPARSKTKPTGNNRNPQKKV